MSGGARNLYSAQLIPRRLCNLSSVHSSTYIDPKSTQLLFCLVLSSLKILFMLSHHLSITLSSIYGHSSSEILEGEAIKSNNGQLY